MMTAVQKGTWLALCSSLGTAIFFLPFKQAGSLVARDMAVLTVMLMAAIITTIPLLVGGYRKLRIDRVTLGISLLLGLLTIAGNYASAQALIRVGAGVTSILQQTQILFVAVAGYFLLGERVSGRFVVGAILVLGGVATMRGPALLDIQAGNDAQGILWALGSSLAFAAMHVSIRKVIDRIQPVTVNGLRLWVCVLVLLCVPGNATTLVALDRDIWLLCAAAAFVGPFISRITLMFSVRHITASHSILITLITPVFAFALDFLVLGDAPTRWQLIGSAVVMAGVALPVAELFASESRTPAAESGS